MNKMTPKSLVAAIVVLTQQGKHVTMIQFEDGSGYKFNYTNGSGDPQFIDMKSDDMTEMVFEAVLSQGSEACSKQELDNVIYKRRLSDIKKLAQTIVDSALYSS